MSAGRCRDRLQDGNVLRGAASSLGVGAGSVPFRGSAPVPFFSYEDRVHGQVDLREMVKALPPRMLAPSGDGGEPNTWGRP